VFDGFGSIHAIWGFERRARAQAGRAKPCFALLRERERCVIMLKSSAASPTAAASVGLEQTEEEEEAAPSSVTPRTIAV
jgi:hypothetical protein